MSNNDIYKLVFPKNTRLPDTCTVSEFSDRCITFPGNRWIVIFPESAESGSGKTLNIGTHNAWYINEGGIIDHDYLLQAFENYHIKKEFTAPQAAYNYLSNANLTADAE